MLLKTRLFYLLMSWLSAGLIYFGSSFFTSNSWIVPESWIDSLIPFSPSGIWLYLLFYVYIPFAFITASEIKVRTMSLAFILTSFISGILFVSFPSSLHYPEFEVNGISSYCLNFVSTNDTAHNCFPSMHASLITISTVALWDNTKKIQSFSYLFLTIAMYYAIIQVRRHVFIDLAAGIGLALVVWGFSIRLLKNKLNH